MATRCAISAGSGVGVLLLPAHVFLSEEPSIAFAAITLAVISGVYIGFGARNAQPGIMILEFGVAIAFAIAALLGWLFLPVLIPAALILHALWDWLHAHPRFHGVAPTWYPPFCAVVDIVAGGGMLLIWLLRGYTVA